MPARRTNHTGQARQRVCDRLQVRRYQPFTSYQPDNAHDEAGKGGEVTMWLVCACFNTRSRFGRLGVGAK
jgi:hypothetical protein